MKYIFLILLFLNVCFAEIAELKKLAAQGDADEQYQLAKLYDDGILIAKNDAEAFKWYTKSADQGNADAQYRLASIIYRSDSSMTQNYAEALKLFKRSADQGNAFSMFELALMYGTGKGTVVNLDEARKWDERFDKAIVGSGMTQSRIKTFNLYKKAAEKGNAGAQHRVGVAYKYGFGVSKDYEESLKWHKKAAEQGHVIAQFIIGLEYHYGKGAPQDFTSDPNDYEEAIKWYKKAAEQGHVMAQNKLKKLCKAGHSSACD